jgi:hypothetical protein
MLAQVNPTQRINKAFKLSAFQKSPDIKLVFNARMIANSWAMSVRYRTFFARHISGKKYD